MRKFWSGRTSMSSPCANMTGGASKIETKAVKLTSDKNTVLRMTGGAAGRSTSFVFYILHLRTASHLIQQDTQLIP